MISKNNNKELKNQNIFLKGNDLKLSLKDDMNIFIIEMNKLLSKKMQILNLQVENETIKLSDNIDKITYYNYQINFLNQENLFLESQKIGNLKNLFFTILSFGCINKNRTIEKKIINNNNKIQNYKIKQKIYEEEFKFVIAERQKINNKLNNLIELNELLKIEDYENINKFNKKFLNSKLWESSFEQDKINNLGKNILNTITNKKLNLF